MSDRIVLTLRQPLTSALDASPITADHLAACTNVEITALSLRYDGEPMPVGELFRVQGERSPHVVLEGDLEHASGIGTGQVRGTLVIEGSVGADVAVGLAGGSVLVRGNAGPNAAGAPPGASRGVTGGEVVIRGAAGEGVAGCMRRGVVAVMGDAAAGAGRGMIAGTLVIGGRAMPPVGRFLKRGSIIVLGEVEPDPLFPYACTYRPPHVPVLFRHLRTAYGLPLSSAHIGGSYRRYCGDMAELGRGEILAWSAA
ncbi:MAG TPA: formylmethanofuran dehydrogenase subunit C [Gemmatimonadales bacterium]|nr:formylmethanofuran dehydrogenase subunit C [Gemmatimonadales bacterium]